MKNIFATLILTVALLFAFQPEKSFAQASGTSVSVDFTSSLVSTAHYQPLITQTARAIKAISILNSGGYALRLGIVGAGGTTDTETQVAIIPASMSVPVVYPIAFSGGYRISIEAITSAVSTGSGQFNFFY